MNLDELRAELMQNGLHENDMDPDPLRQFQAWYQLAGRLPAPQAEAMTLATSAPDGMPSARLVLLRQFDERGFVFFTNYESRKGRELAANPRAALVFYWPQLDRQVRIEGRIERTSAAESDAYFQTRPLGSRLSAWVSAQSDIAAGREVLDQRMRELEEEYRHGNVPRPPYWGGFRVIPHVMEFWQGRPNRLHDRLCYRRRDDGSWLLQRLYP
jgi:pyridoxamine 5'-phosphate oxidase